MKVMQLLHFLLLQASITRNIEAVMLVPSLSKHHADIHKVRIRTSDTTGSLLEWSCMHAQTPAVHAKLTHLSSHCTMYNSGPQWLAASLLVTSGVRSDSSGTAAAVEPRRKTAGGFPLTEEGITADALLDTAADLEGTPGSSNCGSGSGVRAGRLWFNMSPRACKHAHLLLHTGHSSAQILQSHCKHMSQVDAF